MCVFTPPECSPCLKTTRVPAYYISLELRGRKNLGCAILLQELLLRDAGALLLPRMLTSGPGSSPFSESTQGGWQKYKEISDQSIRQDQEHCSMGEEGGVEIRIEHGDGYGH